MSLKKILSILTLAFFSSLIFLSDFVYAHCPLCTAATGAAVITSRWLGVDDLVTGVFIGGLIISTALWFSNILKKGNKGGEYFKFQSLIIFLITLASVVIGFYFLDFIGPRNYFKIFGIDKILLGMFVGIIISVVALEFHKYTRKINGNKNFVPLQSIVLMLVFLVLVSLSFYAIGWMA